MKKKKIAQIALLSTGSELSSGRSRDGNGPYMAEALVAAGFGIHSQHILPDDSEILLEQLEFLLESDAVAIIMTGGLGPTADDLTIDVLAQLANAEIIEDREAFRKLEVSAKRLKSQLRIQEARRQIRTLQDATVLPNRAGLAPGVCLKLMGKEIYALPGVPQEMRAMFAESVLPRLQSQFAIQNHPPKHWYIYGVGESRFQRELGELSGTADWGVTAGYGCIKFTLFHPGPLELGQISAHIEKTYGKTALPDPVEDLLAELLLARGKTIALAESCTGGLAGKILTDAAGSSTYFRGSVVAYANEAKESLLSVPQSLITEHGAVSPQCAQAMATGVREALGVDYSLSITGIAGPGGGTEEKPVGTVYFGMASESFSRSERMFVPLDRERIRLYAVYTGLFHLYRQILEEI